ncbi:chalcone isomerase family protein [Parvibium lacunae]|uniref:Chalcone isomerase domain-containing protein n=1 Tax=Parvibium lacunae TaxID=1888893 RepID=A0A368L0K3_9BURK|nr:chalcone isomerase family protein [Parvibium lacunae]RCS56965.1 hypothetical protein DU000_09140 [Parvibium lacunae]
MLSCLRYVAALLCLFSALPLAAAEIAGERFNPQTQMAGQPLQLNGVGVRSRLGFKVYVAALYLAEPIRQTSELAPRASRRLEIRLLRDLSADTFLEALRKGLQDNTPSNRQEVLRDRVQQLEQVISTLGSVKKGGVILFDYSIESGTRLTVDGKQQGGLIPGEDFANALFHIWLGDKPVDSDLKRGLLGLR